MITRASSEWGVASSGSLLPAPCSLLATPYSLLPIRYSPLTIGSSFGRPGCDLARGVLGPFRHRAVVERRARPVQKLGQDEPAGRRLVAGVAVAHHRLLRHAREHAREIGERLEPQRRLVERAGVIEMQRARHPAGAQGLRAFFPALEIGGRA